jgi:hypothetical protein
MMAKRKKPNYYKTLLCATTREKKEIINTRKMEKNWLGRKKERERELERERERERDFSFER